mmetsp:Transcript_33745/g.96955  ORF Transcript_33745/g.96955 Transcript_33745/m.96955 type:complete len:282 (+) Transcript_33745:647-1492(+)
MRCFRTRGPCRRVAWRQRNWPSRACGRRSQQGFWSHVSWRWSRGPLKRNVRRRAWISWCRNGCASLRGALRRSCRCTRWRSQVRTLPSAWLPWNVRRLVHWRRRKLARPVATCSATTWTGVSRPWRPRSQLRPRPRSFGRSFTSACKTCPAISRRCSRSLTRRRSRRRRRWMSWGRHSRNGLTAWGRPSNNYRAHRRTCRRSSNESAPTCCASGSPASPSSGRPEMRSTGRRRLRHKIRSHRRRCGSGPSWSRCTRSAMTCWRPARSSRSRWPLPKATAPR